MLNPSTHVVTDHRQKQQLRDLNNEFRDTQAALNQAQAFPYSRHSLERGQLQSQTSRHLSERPRRHRRVTHMTHDPRLATLATLEEVMHRDPFELVDSPWGTIEAWRASTMACGTMGALAQVAAIVRSDAASLQEKAAALDAKKSAVLDTVNRLLKFMSRVDELTARVEQLEAKRRADEEEQLQFEEEPELPPDIAEYQTSAPPSKIEDETFAPSGELHAVPTKEEPSEDPSELPEPPVEDSDNEGDLPPEIAPLSDPPPEAKGKVYQQPTALFGS
jgi:hypothetical protein